MTNIEECLDFAGDDALDIVTETYRGKSKDLLQLEKMIGENRKKYFGTFKIGGGYYTDKDFIKIGDKIADIFGFKVCDFNITNDPAPNAFTIPAGYSFSGNGVVRILSTDKDKPIKYKNKMMSLFIRVTSGLWTNDLFTNEEVTAIIIHEVAHNFQQDINKSMRSYMSSMFFIRLIQQITLLCNPMTTAAGIQSIIMGDSELRGKLNKAVKDNNLGWIVNTAGSAMGFIKLILYNITEIIGRATLGIPTGIISLSNIILKGVNNPVSVLVTMVLSDVNKSKENISDDFAAQHGYGPALISALSKFSIDPDADPSAVGRICKKMPVFDCVCTLFALPIMIVSNLFSAHPVTGKRAANIVAELEKELEKTDVSPKMKKEIKIQIKEVKEVIDEYSKVDNPLQGTALRRKILGLQANLDRDPKGYVQRAFSKKDLIESFSEFEDEEFFDSIAEFSLDLI